MSCQDNFTQPEYYLTVTQTGAQGVPKKALQVLSILAQSRCDPDPDHISIEPELTETVMLFSGHPVDISATFLVIALK